MEHPRGGGNEEDGDWSMQSEPEDLYEGWPNSLDPVQDAAPDEVPLVDEASTNQPRSASDPASPAQHPTENASNSQGRRRCKPIDWDAKML